MPLWTAGAIGGLPLRPCAPQGERADSRQRASQSERLLDYGSRRLIFLLPRPFPSGAM